MSEFEHLSSRRSVDEEHASRTSDNPGSLGLLPANQLADLVPIPIVAVHRDGTIVYANAAFTRLLGYDPEDVVGLHASRVLAGLDHVEGGLSTLRGERSEAIVDLRHREGWVLHAVASSSALLRDDDPVSLVTVFDVTEQLWSQSSYDPPFRTLAN